MDGFRLEDLEMLPEGSFYITKDGKHVEPSDLGPNDQFRVWFRVLGGKGGFGSLLRSFRIYRSSNQEMCRDLSGRRLRDKKEEERLKKWILSKAEREKSKEQKLKEKYERLKAGPPKHVFQDPEYSKTLDDILDSTDDAFDHAMKARAGPSTEEATRKRKLEEETLEEAENKKPKADQEHKVEKSEQVKQPPPAPEQEELLEKQEIKQPVVEVKDPPKEPVEYDAVELESMESEEQLGGLGLEHLKAELSRRGLKCGGTLEQRAQRLWSVRGLQPNQYPKKLKAKP